MTLRIILISLALGTGHSAVAQVGGPYQLTWSTIDGGGGVSSGGPYRVAGTIGQPDAGRHGGGRYQLDGGFWAGVGSPAPGCRADCDGNGVLDFFDFLCFQNEFATGDMGADCDGNGILDFFDFLCFQNEFAAGCP